METRLDSESSRMKDESSIIGEAASKAGTEEILRLCRVILDAICTHDDRVLDVHLAAEFVLFDDASRSGRSEFLDAVRTEAFVTLESGFESIEADVFDTTAVAAGVQRVEVELPDGSRVVSRGLFTDVFVRAGDGWLLRFAHSVELG